MISKINSCKSPRAIFIAILVIMTLAFISIFTYAILKLAINKSANNDSESLNYAMPSWNEYKSSALNFSIEFPRDWKTPSIKESSASKQAIFEFKDSNRVIWVEKIKSFYSPDLHRYETIEESIARQENYIKSFPEFKKETISLRNSDAVKLSYKSKTGKNLLYSKIFEESKKDENDLFYVTILSPYEESKNDLNIDKVFATFMALDNETSGNSDDFQDKIVMSTFENNNTIFERENADIDDDGIEEIILYYSPEIRFNPESQYDLRYEKTYLMVLKRNNSENYENIFGFDMEGRYDSDETEENKIDLYEQDKSTAKIKFKKDDKRGIFFFYYNKEKRFFDTIKFYNKDVANAERGDSQLPLDSKIEDADNDNVKEIFANGYEYKWDEISYSYNAVNPCFLNTVPDETNPTLRIYKAESNGYKFQFNYSTVSNLFCNNGDISINNAYSVSMPKTIEKENVEDYKCADGSVETKEYFYARRITTTCTKTITENGFEVYKKHSYNSYTGDSNVTYDLIKGNIDSDFVVVTISPGYSGGNAMEAVNSFKIMK